MANYIALLCKEADSNYGVSFPDFPGCITVGGTLEEARRQADEALEFHIHGLREDGEVIPAPSSLDLVVRDVENREAVVFLVEVKSSEPKAVRVNVTFAEDVLDRIDQHVKAARTTRSRRVVPS